MAGGTSDSVLEGSADDLVGLEKQCRGQRGPERLGGLEVDDELERGGLLDGEVSRLGPFEEFVHVRGEALSPLGTIGPIAHEPTRLDKRTVVEDRRQPVWTSGRIQTETYGFAVEENCPLVHEPDFDFLDGFSDRFSAQNSLLSEQ
jgi:hypothetical protein